MSTILCTKACTYLMQNLLKTKSVTMWLFYIIETEIYVSTTYTFLKKIPWIKIGNLIILRQTYERFSSVLCVSNTNINFFWKNKTSNTLENKRDKGFTISISRYNSTTQICIQHFEKICAIDHYYKMTLISSWRDQWNRYTNRLIKWHRWTFPRLYRTFHIGLPILTPKINPLIERVVWERIKTTTIPKVPHFDRHNNVYV